jgi:hypothetical protein
MADAAGGGAKVGSECRLPIRPRWHKVVRSSAHETGAEAADDVAAGYSRGMGGLLQGVLGVLQGSEHPVAVHLQLAAVRRGSVSSRNASLSPVRALVMRSVVTPPPSVRSLALLVALPSIDTGRVANWARPFSRHRGVCICNGLGRSERRRMAKEQPSTNEFRPGYSRGGRV